MHNLFTRYVCAAMLALSWFGCSTTSPTMKALEEEVAAPLLCTDLATQTSAQTPKTVVSEEQKPATQPNLRRALEEQSAETKKARSDRLNSREDDSRPSKTIHYTSGLTQPADEVIDNDLSYYHVEYKGRIFSVPKRLVSSITDYTPASDPPKADRRAAPAPQPKAEAASTVAENGSYYGQISENTGRPKTVHVNGYYRKDGTYVRGHYRSAPR